MSLPLVDWIWHVRGAVPLPQGQSGAEALDRLDPLFHETGTSRERHGDTLVFRKRDQAAQDPMSVFDGGELRVEPGTTGPVLRYRLKSRALLFCFLAPLLFLAFAQLTIVLNALEKPAAQAAKTAEPPKPAPTLNPVDKLLGAPAPDQPGKDGESGGGKRGRKPTPIAAYVFAGLFAALYVIGRVLEARLVQRLFARRLTPATS